MSDTPVIYENPKHPLPEWANWMVKFLEGFCTAFEIRPFGVNNQTWSASGRFGNLVGYTIPGLWQDSLRRIVRLTDPAYYCAENPYTDDEGFLPHDGGPMPEWVRGKRVMVRLRQSGTTIRMTEWSNRLRWLRSGKAAYGDIIAYRIVGEQEEAPLSDRIRDKGVADPDVLHSTDKIEAEAKRIRKKHDQKESEMLRSGVLPSDGVLPRGHQYQDVYTEDERRHRNELAARTLTPVPGMDEWMHDVIREARRFDYANAALQGMLAGLASDPNVTLQISTLVNEVGDIAGAMIEKEDIDGRQ